MAGYLDEYSGLQWFAFLSEWSGMSIDQVNFILTQVVSLAVAPLFRTLLHPARVGSTHRHGVGLILGMAFSYICFGMQTVHLYILPAITYLIMTYQDPKTMPRSVLAVSLIYLSSIHFHRQFYFGTYMLDISGPLMIVVQKITSLAYSVHDGVVRDEKHLSENQKYYAVDQVPSPYEYFSYVFHHQTIMAGPVIFYKDYINFINGAYLIEQLSSQTSPGDVITSSIKEPSARRAVVYKVLGSVTCAILYLKMSLVYPLEAIKTDEFILNTSLLYKLWYLNWATTLVRFKYYYAWMFADAVCNNSGLGFNGYDPNGVAKWDKVSNVDVVSFELGRNFREAINAWNIGTNRWLRMIVYERVKKSPTLLTYGLSALWHGFYPGYYITFASAALFTVTARTMRRCLRDYFQSTKEMRVFYDVLTAISTRIVFGYITFSFVLLDFWPTFRLYMHMYLSLHILALVAIFVIPKILPKKRNKRESDHQKISGQTGNGSVSSMDSETSLLMNDFSKEAKSASEDLHHD